MADKKFETAAQYVAKITEPLTNEDYLEWYSYYKQATVGDINISRPGGIDVKAKSKWDAWNSKKGVSKEDAKDKYIKKAVAHGFKE